MGINPKGNAPGNTPPLTSFPKEGGGTRLGTVASQPSGFNPFGSTSFLEDQSNKARAKYRGIAASDLSTGEGFTGTDVTAYAILPRTEYMVEDFDGAASFDSPIIKMGTMRSISISTFREKQPVRSLGAIYPKSFVRGGRTVAGTMIFSIIYESVFAQIKRQYEESLKTVAHEEFPYSLGDQLPPMDFLLKLNNEVGHASHIILYGVEFFADGIALSVDNLIIEQQIRYQARGYSELVYDGRGNFNFYGQQSQKVIVDGQSAASSFFNKVLASGGIESQNFEKNTDYQFFMNEYSRIQKERRPFT